MLASGNGDVATCVGNIVKTIRGTVPFERFKGIPRQVFDRPLTADNYDLRIAVQENLKSYERRVENPRQVDVEVIDPTTGDVRVNIGIERSVEWHRSETGA